MMQVNNSPEAVEKLISEFSRTTDEIITLEQLRESLLSGQQMTFKYGVDLTAPDLHIGHAVNLWMYRSLQELGHRIVLLLGDFTTQIGDPTGKSKTRPVLPPEVIASNAEAILQQALKVLINEPEVLSIRRNSEWLNAMRPSELLTILASTTVDKLLSRDMFKKRMADGQPIAANELLYPILQGWDSVALEASGTIIGSDQLFNEMMGRTLQEQQGQAPQVIITSKITPGIDGGEKQSKSLGNYIAINHSPRDKYGRLMRLPDNLVEQYLYVYTLVPEGRIREIVALQRESPIDAKAEMAFEIVARWHGHEIAEEERLWFHRTFREKQTPLDVVEISAPEGSTYFDVVKAALPDSSNSAIRRLFLEGGIRINQQKVQDPDAGAEFQGGLLQIGKRRWFQVHIEN